MLTSQMTNRTRSIDYRAPEKEWQSLFEWIERHTRLMMKSNDSNPWLKPLIEEEQKSFVPVIYDWLPWI